MPKSLKDLDRSLKRLEQQLGELREDLDEAMQAGDGGGGSGHADED